jgi:hypothetical protein
VTEIKDNKSLPRTGACVGLFNDETKELIKVITSKKKGRFSFSGIKEGKYRLIITDGLFFSCIASIRIEVIKKTKTNKRIVVHMISEGLIDKCSYGEIE